MTGIALMIRGPGHNFPGAMEFVIAVLVIIVVDLLPRVRPAQAVRGRRRSAQTTRRTVRRSAHRSGRPTTHGHNPVTSPATSAAAERRTPIVIQATGGPP